MEALIKDSELFPENKTYCEKLLNESIIRENNINKKKFAISNVYNAIMFIYLYCSSTLVIKYVYINNILF